LQRKYSAEFIASFKGDVDFPLANLAANVIDVECALRAVDIRENVVNIGLPTARQKLSKFPDMEPVSYGSCAVRPSHGKK